MSKNRLIAALAAAATVGGVALLLPTGTAEAATCAAPWSSGTVYTGGKTASYTGHNWLAKWWTQGETPGRADVWTDQGTCGGTTPPTTTTPPTSTTKPPTSTTTSTPPQSTGFVVSEAQFNQMFPSRNSFYTYKGLTDAITAYPSFANTGGDTIKRQEAAAFLANVNHETGGLVYVKETNTANYPHYCDASQPYGCPAGQAAYYGRGPIQLSWNFNYKAAGDALGIDLLHNPYLVEQDAAVAWKTALWYWMTQNGPGTMTPHDAMVNSRGFGETIRSINGSLECNGGNPAQVQSRVNSYQKFTQLLGVTPGSNLTC
ncbi:glycoside hydrolase family 19 protein [Actinokineospora inagensis]|uniref:glycoside hydrolase family 19 protein n=1 Tax=Actinokineospora inagensis TaxID=103730 RepID=UPI00041316AF|nr:glycoside hydrolase family 19 protein [Actinokineospora inagensis]